VHQPLDRPRVDAGAESDRGLPRGKPARADLNALTIDHGRGLATIRGDAGKLALGPQRSIFEYRALSAKMVAVFSTSSSFKRLMATVFLPSSASRSATLALNSPILISSRRVDMANSARRCSLSARASSMDSGIEASSRRLVRRAERLWTSGTITRERRLAARNPSPVAAMHSVHASPLRDVSVLPVTAPDAGG